MIVGTQKSEKSYREVELDSSSSLKEFAANRIKYYKKYVLREKEEDEEESKASTIGRICETLLLEKDQFDNRFYLSSVIKGPSGLMEVFVSSLLKYSKEPYENFEEIARKAYKDSGYKISFEKVLEKFVGTDHEIFFRESLEVQSKGLTVVTLQDVQNSEKIVELLKTNQTTK